MSEKKIVCDCFPLSLSPGPYSFSHWFITVVEDQYETLGLEWGLIQAVWHKWQIFTLVLRIGWLIRIVCLRNACVCTSFDKELCWLLHRGVQIKAEETVATECLAV